MNGLRLTRSALLRGACPMSLAVIAATLGSGAQAQAQAQGATPVEGEISEVVITGSRTIRDGSQAPTPVTVVSIDQLQQASPRNLTEGLAALPAFRGVGTTTTPATGVNRNAVGSFLNLRNLGSERTLILVDGRRIVPASSSGETNIDMIPQSLIRRVDVVTGGASAGYGSDAVAGVANFILDTDYTGMKGRIQGGVSDRGDAGSYKFEISAGGKYLDDRLHLLASYGNNRINSVESPYERSWNRPFAGYITGISIASGSTARVLARDVRQASYPGGVIFPTAPLSQVSYATGLFDAQGNALRANQTSFANPLALQNLKFLPNGVSSPYDSGLNRNATNQIGGDGIVNTAALSGLLEAETTFFRAGFDVTDNLRVFFQMSTADTHNKYTGGLSYNYQQTVFTIFEGNPYIPASTAASLAAANFTLDTFVADPLAAGGRRKTALGTRSLCNLAANLPEVGSNAAAPFVRCFKLSRYNFDAGPLTGDINGQSSDFVTGFDAVMFGDWRIDGYYEHGENLVSYIAANNTEFENSFAGADVIANPAVGGVPGVAAGAPVCRIDVTNPGAYNGCQPFNPFGHDSSSRAAGDFAATDGTFQQLIKQHVAAINIAGEPFELPAGPLTFAIGAEYRKQFIKQTSDPVSQLAAKFVGARANVRGVPAQLVGVAGGRNQANVTPFEGEYDVKEGYVEVNVPLLSDLPLIQELSVNAAGRYTNYSTSGEVNTWKVGLSYRPSELIRFRSTLSRDIRAPGLSDLFRTGAGFQRTFNDPFKNNAPVQVLEVGGGDPTLAPEIADSVTAGIVFTPSWIPGLTATIDYYDIKISDALGALTAQGTIDRCFEGALPICANIEHDGPGLYNGTSEITRVNLPELNLSSVRSKGIDFELGYRTAIGDIPGQFNFRLFLGYVTEQSSQVPGGERNNNAGNVGVSDNPRLRGLLQVAYDNGPITLSIQGRYVSHGYYDNNLVEGLTINDNTMGDYALADINTRYRFGVDEQYEAFLSVVNVFDQEPLFGPVGSVNSFLVANSSLYDHMGRYYTTGLRFRF